MLGPVLIWLISLSLTGVFYATLFKKLPATKWVRVPMVFPGAIILILLLNAVQGIAGRLLIALLQVG